MGFGGPARQPLWEARGQRGSWAKRRLDGLPRPLFPWGPPLIAPCSSFRTQRSMPAQFRPKPYRALVLQDRVNATSTARVEGQPPEEMNLDCTIFLSLLPKLGLQRISGTGRGRVMAEECVVQHLLVGAR